ncbi:hypothetical protein E2C01_047955 [Portunus trituberculatus]|uniref:Uncharacterized protein n=1 Tax=Portunus trituberculatus TaxID=210409 RepID=A0A5B7GA88_PORTR|nr:hypothetical protein [Portunus trituberculatus]
MEHQTPFPCLDQTANLPPAGGLSRRAASLREVEPFPPPPKRGSLTDCAVNGYVSASQERVTGGDILKRLDPQGQSRQVLHTAPGTLVTAIAA